MAEGRRCRPPVRSLMISRSVDKQSQVCVQYTDSICRWWVGCWSKVRAPTEHCYLYTPRGLCVPQVGVHGTVMACSLAVARADGLKRSVDG
jgi:hypothetical protein